MSYFGYGPSRLVCSVLEEQRAALKTLNEYTMERYKLYAPSLIEEAQTLVNRMDAGLEDQADLRDMIEEKAKLKKEIKKLRAEKKDLTGEDD